MPEQVTPTRRARLRAQTLAEIKEHALAQVAEAGADALSLSAIARAMGMSGPALYRYFDSRDALLAVLVADAYDDLAARLEVSAAAARRRTPVARFRAMADAYRDWALAHPHRYRLALGTSYGSGRFAPEATLPAAGRNMVVLLDAVADLGPLPPARPGAIRTLDRQLERWAKDRGLRPDVPPAALELAVLAWTRMHGLVSLEIEGVFSAMTIDPALLYRAEVDQLIAQHAVLSGRDAEGEAA